MKKILMVASEAVPFAKSGGLGDVLGALPQAMKKLGNDVRVVLPKYSSIPWEYVSEMEFLFYIYVPVGWRNKYCGVFRLVRDGVIYYFLDNEYYFKRDGLYGEDDLERFAFFDKAALEILIKLEFRPDIIHCNDWHTGMIPVILKAYFGQNEFYRGIKTLFTIHNLKYQGIYSIEAAKDLFSLGDEFFTDDKLEFHGNCNFLKAGIVYSDLVSTVSPTYAEEIKGPMGGEGLDGLLFARGNSLYGILNGIDYNEFSPKTDGLIEANYGWEDFSQGKRENKISLQKRLGLFVDGEKAMIGIVSRLVEQKGFRLIREALDEIMSLDVQLVVLGTGEAQYENMFKEYAWRYPEKLSANIMFSDELAHKIYASSDIFLMPSLFEPCGLSQLIAMSYGTVPLVRETGGLRDTVKPFNEFTGEGNGFSFSPPYAHDMVYTLRRALNFFGDRKVWQGIVENGMAEDFSWEEAARKYETVYSRLLE